MCIYTGAAHHLYNVRIAGLMRLKYPTIEQAYTAGYLGRALPFKDFKIKVEADGFDETLLFEVFVNDKHWYEDLYARVAARLGSEHATVVFDGTPLHDYGLLNVIHNHGKGVIYKATSDRPKIVTRKDAELASSNARPSTIVISSNDYTSIVKQFFNNLVNEFATAVHTVNDGQQAVASWIQDLEAVNDAALLKFVEDYYVDYTLSINNVTYDLPTIVEEQNNVNGSYFVYRLKQLLGIFVTKALSELNAKRSLPNEDAVVSVILSVIDDVTTEYAQTLYVDTAPAPPQNDEAPEDNTEELDVEPLGAELRSIGIKFSTVKRKLQNAKTTVTNAFTKSKIVRFSIAPHGKSSRFAELAQQLEAEVEPGDVLKLTILAGDNPKFVRVDIEENQASELGRFSKQNWHTVASHVIRRPTTGQLDAPYFAFPLSWAQYRVRAFVEDVDEPEQWHDEGTRTFNCRMSGVKKGKNTFTWEQLRKVTANRDRWADLKITEELLNARTSLQYPLPYREFDNGPVQAWFPPGVYKCLQRSWDADRAEQPDDALALVYWSSYKSFALTKAKRIRRARYTIWAQFNNASLDTHRYETEPIDIPGIDDEYTNAPVIPKGTCPDDGGQIGARFAPVGIRQLPNYATVSMLGSYAAVSNVARIADSDSLPPPSLPLARKAYEERLDRVLGITPSTVPSTPTVPTTPATPTPTPPPVRLPVIPPHATRTKTRVHSSKIRLVRAADRTPEQLEIIEEIWARRPVVREAIAFNDDSTVTVAIPTYVLRDFTMTDGGEIAQLEESKPLLISQTSLAVSNGRSADNVPYANIGTTYDLGKEVFGIAGLVNAFFITYSGSPGVPFDYESRPLTAENIKEIGSTRSNVFALLARDAPIISDYERELDKVISEGIKSLQHDDELIPASIGNFPIMFAKITVLGEPETMLIADDNGNAEVKARLLKRQLRGVNPDTVVVGGVPVKSRLGHDQSTHVRVSYNVPLIMHDEATDSRHVFTQTIHDNGYLGTDEHTHIRTFDDLRAALVGRRMSNAKVFGVNAANFSLDLSMEPFNNGNILMELVRNTVSVLCAGPASSANADAIDTRFVERSRYLRARIDANSLWRSTGGDALRRLADAAYDEWIRHAEEAETSDAGATSSTGDVMPLTLNEYKISKATANGKSQLLLDKIVVYNALSGNVVDDAGYLALRGDETNFTVEFVVPVFAYKNADKHLYFLTEVNVANKRLHSDAGVSTFYATSITAICKAFEPRIADGKLMALNANIDGTADYVSLRGGTGFDSVARLWDRMNVGALLITEQEVGVRSTPATQQLRAAMTAYFGQDGVAKTATYNDTLLTLDVREASDATSSSSDEAPTISEFEAPSLKAAPTKLPTPAPLAPRGSSGAASSSVPETLTAFKRAVAARFNKQSTLDKNVLLYDGTTEVKTDDAFNAVVDKNALLVAFRMPTILHLKDNNRFTANPQMIITSTSLIHNGAAVNYTQGGVTIDSIVRRFLDEPVTDLFVGVANTLTGVIEHRRVIAGNEQGYVVNFEDVYARLDAVYFYFTYENEKVDSKSPSYIQFSRLRDAYVPLHSPERERAYDALTHLDAFVNEFVVGVRRFDVLGPREDKRPPILVTTVRRNFFPGLPEADIALTAQVDIPRKPVALIYGGRIQVLIGVFNEAAGRPVYLTGSVLARIDGRGASPQNSKLISMPTVDVFLNALLGKQPKQVLLRLHQLRVVNGVPTPSTPTILRTAASLEFAKDLVTSGTWFIEVFIGRHFTQENIGSAKANEPLEYVSNPTNATLAAWKARFDGEIQSAPAAVRDLIGSAIDEHVGVKRDGSSSTLTDVEEWIDAYAKDGSLYEEPGDYLIFLPETTAELTGDISDFVARYTFAFNKDDGSIHSHSRKIPALIDGQHLLIRRNYDKTAKRLTIDVQTDDGRHIERVPVHVHVRESDPSRIIASVRASDFLHFVYT